ncbi:ABC transporter ATP-binding protein [Salinibacterium sp. SYSU T00001]|uniref:ABC transporter ATP-binding protein n=1 Tax=Homoserinimonas sedimenticola TaxID=2986805 RepID=UPI00223622AF|nr:ABC transporter ATP-binding protein [Salinibacterium sedimenticola]MCW4384624.1 ABC transporter ATP-binding protein [Salinibacterium sedimenticola]
MPSTTAVHDDTTSRAVPGADGATPSVRVEGLRKRFRREDGSEVLAINDVTFDVAPGEFIVLLGPSGCGKTTLLRTIAGLETPDEGVIEIGGRTAFASQRGIAQPPERRGISMIFQSYALWPHMTVFKNIAYPLTSRKGLRLSRADIETRVRTALAQVGIPELEGQYPSQMSGGQQQRVALARALVSNDDLILFDEPLSNVDAKVREQLRLELVSMQRKLGFSALFVTHDQTEAMELATRIAVVDSGRIAQFGTPQEIYSAPATRYVARFIGAINEIEGVVSAVESDHVVLDTPHGRVVSRDTSAGLLVGEGAVALWRPERGHLDTEEPNTVNRWRVTVDAAMFVGSHTEYLVRSGDMSARLWSPRFEDVASGSSSWASVSPADVRVLPITDGEGGPAVTGSIGTTGYSA